MWEKACGFLKTVPGGLSQLIIRLKVSQELLSPWEQLNFWKSSCYRPIRSQRKKFIDCKKCQTNLVDPRKVFLDLCFVRSNEKNCPKPFLHWKDCLSFQKILFSTTSQVLKKRSLFFHSKCQTSFWTNRNCPLRFVKLEDTMKNWPEIFPHWKNCVFFKKLCFQQPLKSWSNDLSFSTVFVTLASELVETVPWLLSHSIIAGGIGQKLFFTGKFAFLSKNCVFNNFLGHKELIL